MVMYANEFKTKENQKLTEIQKLTATHILIQTLKGLGEFSTVMQTLDFVSGLHNYLEFSQPLSCLYQTMQTQKTFSIA